MKQWLVPGSDDKMLANGGKIEFSQSAVNLEEMIGKFMFSGGGVDKGGAAKPGATAAPATSAPAPAATTEKQ